MIEILYISDNLYSVVRPVRIHSNSEFDSSQNRHYDHYLQIVLDRLIATIERDRLVRQTTNQLRESLQVDRVVLYYFYCQWKGQVMFESLSSNDLSILGSTEPIVDFLAAPTTNHRISS